MNRVKKAQITTAEIPSETEAFVERIQAQFEQTGLWDMPSLETILREALLKEGCRILEGLLNQPKPLEKRF